MSIQTSNHRRKIGAGAFNRSVTPNLVVRTVVGALVRFFGELAPVASDNVVIGNE